MKQTKTKDRKLVIQTIIFTILWIVAAATICYLVKLQYMEYVLSFISVFLAVMVADVCWTFYFIKIEERKSIGASLS